MAEIKKIEVGKFYFIHDGSETGHPGLIVWKDDEANRYLVIKTDSDKFGDVPKDQRGVRHITRLNKTIGDGIAASYVKNRPLLCKRKDIGIVLNDLSFGKDDIDIIEKISKNKPVLSRSLRRKT